MRRQLGVGPGSVLIWEWRDGGFVVRRAGKSTSADIHAALFGAGVGSPGRKAADIEAAIRRYMRQRHARR